jgi:hypothetical protein
MTRVVSQETREKISKSLKGRFLGNTNGFKKGHTLTKGRPAPWAKNNPQTFKKGHIPWSKNQKGIHLSPETEFKKGVSASPKTQFLKGQTAWNKGLKGYNSGEKSSSWKGGKIFKKCAVCDTTFSVYPLKATQTKTCSKKCCGILQSKNRIGDKSANWKGGVTPEHQKIRTSIEYDLWRNAVLARDNYTCQKTGVRGGKLVAHHINNFAKFPELRTSIENGVTFSEKAHKDFHKKYGIKNNTKEQLEEFINDTP